MDVTTYKSWSSTDLVNWIISLDGGEKYKQYENNLRKSFVEEEVDGEAMGDIDAGDLRNWGVKRFKDRTNICKHIENVIKDANCNDP